MTNRNNLEMIKKYQRSLNEDVLLKSRQHGIDWTVRLESARMGASYLRSCHVSIG